MFGMERFLAVIPVASDVIANASLCVPAVLWASLMGGSICPLCFLCPLRILPYKQMANWYYYNEKGEKTGATKDVLGWLVENGTITPETRIENKEGEIVIAKTVEWLTFKHSTNCGNFVANWKDPCQSCGAMPIGHRKHCRHCGTALNPEQVICVKCKAKVEAGQNTGSGSNGWIGALILIILVLLGIAWFIDQNNTNRRLQERDRQEQIYRDIREKAEDRLHQQQYRGY